MRNGQERKAYLAKIDAARAAAEERAKAEEQVARLEHAEEFFEERLSAGSPIAHRSFGVGRVIGRPSKYLIEVEFPEKSRSVTLVWRDCIKSGIISLKTGVDKGEYDELVGPAVPVPTGYGRKLPLLRKSLQLMQNTYKVRLDEVRFFPNSIPKSAAGDIFRWRFP